MEKLSIEEVQTCALEMLCALRDLCEKNNLTYSLTGGTLIGAIRHKGFIPWDDDIDIMMPRPDYDRFMQIVKDSNDLSMRVLSAEICGKDYPYAFAKVCHPHTKLIEDEAKDIQTNLGVYVDVFPVDGIGNSHRQAKWRSAVFRFLYGLKVASNWKRYHRSKLRSWYWEPFRYLCYLTGKIVGRKYIDQWIDTFVRKKSFVSSTYAGRLVGDFGTREIMERAVFETTIKVEFAGQQFDAIKGYDVFLKRLYGDYMQLPPIEKRVTHHTFNAYRMD